MRRRVGFGAAIAAAILAAALTPSCTLKGKEDTAIYQQPARRAMPAIDAEAPASVETATFALG